MCIEQLSNLIRGRRGAAKRIVIGAAQSYNSGYTTRFGFTLEYRPESFRVVPEVRIKSIVKVRSAFFTISRFARVLYVETLGDQFVALVIL